VNFTSRGVDCIFLHFGCIIGCIIGLGCKKKKRKRKTTQSVTYKILPVSRVELESLKPFDKIRNEQK